MRTSHQRIHSVISQEKTKITDKELFSSVPYRAYLSDIAETAVGKFKRKISIITEWDESPNAFVAYTDNKVITLNTGNRLTAEFVERIHKNLSLIGITAHEIGHILYTDFTVLSMFMQAVDNGTFYPVIPKNLEDDDEENLNEILDIIKEKDETKNTLIKYILHNIANILEDVFIEEKICFEFPGRFKTGIRINCAIQSETALCVSEMKKRNLPDIMVLLNLILYYAKTGDVDKENNILYDKLCECIELIDNAVSDAKKKGYDELIKIHQAAYDRYTSVKK